MSGGIGPVSSVDVWPEAAQVLRKLALNEELKWAVPNDLVLGPIAKKVAGRFIAGENLAEATGRAQDVLGAGHRVNVEYMGESCRDAQRAAEETKVFLEAAEVLPAQCSICFDLSHIGLAIDEELALENATHIAEATARTGREMIISAEGSDRTDAMLGVHKKLASTFDHVGITLQARLHRSAGDLQELLSRPGRIRLVKGAFLEPEAVAYRREDPALPSAFLDYAQQLADSRHLCSFATHDWDMIRRIEEHLQDDAREDTPWEFETLLGLGRDRLDEMARRGHPTRTPGPPHPGVHRVRHRVVALCLQPARRRPSTPLPSHSRRQRLAGGLLS